MISKNALGMATFMVVAAISSVQAQDLWLDFNSLSQDNGPHPNEAYQQEVLNFKKARFSAKT